MEQQRPNPGTFWRAWLLGWVCGVTFMAIIYVVFGWW
jgi:hypothetical protein